ncbi:MAG: nicotinate-nucleotide--dimethylbenzimidazole phosphoribosyltransferase [Ruminococcus sp.]|nr:nicotinate-nucleotide--dimethylbenzimidazole phosphoribosyltransferase [Ruminococcus sp.]MCM1382373.1 nicotinate-nucleotide--dimethylbenzimidazole phosphoribosyltransferase [Muribaculaceae bacterium]MCM1480370.1 nicotinate-nucleotide--dimethylbenzimidazole phosphoribosyltransferase [Muribaculaceae bacterium]
MDRIKKIKHADREIFLAAKARWDSVAKPLGSLGLLEDAVCKIAAVQKNTDVKIDVRKVVVMCADNGVTAENVTQSDSVVTAICAKAIAEGTSNINALAAVFGADVIAADVGINRDVNSEKILNKKIAYGTKNIAAGAAMTRAQAEKSISVGIDIVRDLKKSGAQIIIAGEMGIGNTATAAAISAVLLDVSVRFVTGRGAGLDSAGLERKIAVIEKAIAVNCPEKNDPIGVISKLGGFDIGGMTGLFLGGAVYEIPVVIDGVISAAAALLAKKIAPISAEYMLASHVSSEPAGKLLLEKIGVKPLINAEMRLGEGTGGIMLLPLLDGALAVYKNAHKFDEIGIERYVELK